jgi:vacuolar-type H+-ATPase subunit H
LENLLDYLDDIEDILEGAKRVPFKNNIVMVEKDRISAIINEIRCNLPNEFRTAQRTLDDRDKLLEEARHKAEIIKRDAELDARALVNDSEIFQRASEQATETIEEAKHFSRDLRHNANEYCDEILEKTELKIAEVIETLDQQHQILIDFLRDNIDTIYGNRQELREMT